MPNESGGFLNPAQSGLSQHESEERMNSTNQYGRSNEGNYSDVQDDAQRIYALTCVQPNAQAFVFQRNVPGPQATPHTLCVVIDGKQLDMQPFSFTRCKTTNMGKPTSSA